MYIVPAPVMKANGVPKTKPPGFPPVVEWAIVPSASLGVVQPSALALKVLVIWAERLMQASIKVTTNMYFPDVDFMARIILNLIKLMTY